MTDVNGTTRAPMKLLLVDATCNKYGFEYEASNTIHDKLAKRGVPLVENGVLQPTTFRGVFEALDPSKRDFSSLLYFAHGSAEDGEEAATVQAGDFTTTWELLDVSGIELTDKFVTFCVCHGYCNSMIESMARGGPFALTVVAPDKKLLKPEALDFFPAFYEALVPLTQHDIDPNHVRDTLAKVNHLATDKMQVFSQGLSQ